MQTSRCCRRHRVALDARYLSRLLGSCHFLQPSYLGLLFSTSSFLKQFQNHNYPICFTKLLELCKNQSFTMKPDLVEILKCSCPDKLMLCVICNSSRCSIFAKAFWRLPLKQLYCICKVSSSSLSPI